MVSKADDTVEPVLITGYIEFGDYGNLYSVDTSERDRMARADDTIVFELNKDKKSGMFIGSEGDIYHTTLNKCSCPDFVRRRAACKHMFRLANEFGEAVSVKPRREYIYLVISALIALLFGIFASGWLSFLGWLSFIVLITSTYVLHSVDKEIEANRN